jgi:hypothetical protein
MATWDKWFPDVLPQVPGCPNPVVRHELRRAAQALLTATRAWQENLAPLPVAAGQDEVTIAPTTPAQQQIVRIESVWLDGQRLEPVTPDELDGATTDNWGTHTGAPSRYLQLTPGVLTLYPTPAANAITGLLVRVSLCPSDTATTIPDDLALRYSDEIQVGARARLMLYPNKPWSNPQLGITYAQDFNGAIGAAAAKAARAQVRGRIASRPTWA